VTELPPNTPCFLTNLTERPELIGRIVEVVSLVTVADEPGDWYEARAGWSEEELHAGAIHVRRENLRPIVPPNVAQSAKKRATEKIAP
jgi:hypothetical protein